MNGEIFGYWLMMRLAQMGWEMPFFINNPWRCPLKVAAATFAEEEG